MVIKNAFTNVDVSAGVKFYYTVGSSNTVRIVGPEDQVGYTEVTVESGTLKAYLKREKLPRNSRINVSVYVTAPAFRNAKITSGACCTLTTEMTIPGDFTVNGSSGAIFKSDKGLKCAALKVEASSGVNIDIDRLETVKAHLSSSSGAIVTLKGEATALNVGISSGAIANLLDLQVKEGSVDASSGAIVNVRKGILSVHTSSGAIINQN